MNGGKDGSELHVGHRWNESLNVLNGKGASDFLSEKFDAQIRRYYFWRSCLVYLDSEKQALVVERGGVVDHEIKISDVLRVLKDPRGLVVQDRHMKEVVFRVNDEAIQNSFFVALRALVGEAHEAAMINSRFAVAEQMFRDADTDTNGKLDVQEVTQLLSKLQFEMPPEQVAVLCNRGDAELDRSALALNMKATVTSKEFLDIFSRVMHRKEVLTSVFYVYAGDNNVMNHRELIEFLVEEQKEGRDAAKAAARTIIEKYSTTKTSKASTLDVNGFMDFLQGGDNQAWDPCHAHIFMDMTQPLCNYFIASSHNTYLAGNQLTGAASAEAYSKSLQDGARCVEVDLWEDEDGEPTITHGHTLTGEIKFRDVLDVVGKETISFAKSSFPLIISMEDHLTRASRLRLVQIMKENRGFWSMLYRPDPKMSLKDRMKLSPMDLKNKILIKMKVKKETPPELAELILIRGAKLKGSWEDAMALPPLSCVSHDESRVQQFCEEGEGPQLIEFNHAHLTRVYPAGKRVDSSNFDPTPAWLHGCQLVALNYQTIDQPWFVNKAIFTVNGGCGYVLKPPRLLGLAPLDTQILVEVRVLYGQCICPADAEPYVSVRATYCRGVTKFKTPKATGNGLNVGFQHQSETPSDPFTFEIYSKELAVLIMKVKVQQKRSKKQMRMYGVIPVNYLREGYRVVALYDEQSSNALPNYVQLICHFKLK